MTGGSTQLLTKGDFWKRALTSGVMGVLTLGTLTGCMEESPDLLMAPDPGAQTAAQPMAAPGAPPAGVVGAGSGAPVMAKGTGSGVAGAGSGVAAAGGGSGVTGTGSGSAPAVASSPTTPAAGTGSGVATVAKPPTTAPVAASPTPAAAPGTAATPAPGLVARLLSGTPSKSAAPSAIPRVTRTQAEKPLYAQTALTPFKTGIALEGTVSCDICKGTVLLNVVSPKGLLVSVPGIKPGPFSIQVPISVGAVTVTAIGDDNSDGVPTAGEPLGAYIGGPLIVGNLPVTGLSITVGKAQNPTQAPPPK